MATIIEVGDGSFIAGDPPATLPDDSHWCQWCGGGGLEYDMDGYLTVCGGCSGVCVVVCTDPSCSEHHE